jgi:predicted nuclease of predicted toxin-antitoxin system
VTFRLLLDEMTEGSLAEYLQKMGHDVERVVECPKLGPETDDSLVVAYAERENRLLVTADDDFLTEHDEPYHLTDAWL